ncbi:VOC family protein [Streptomyces sp. NBC_00094]|uniref:VOC family protein n=1 Tax=Streptomyces sp. NBC_00094 TaxID=2903620 RepID=UPI0022542118|nr:VOC family protein [Streptomyces sp. NBC_00094]MCX5394971.1 VOC family protein [Streptomyces sp. NBC_00094]
MSRDMVSAQHFYSGVLDWEFRASRLGDGFAVAFLDGAPVAGIGALTERFVIPVAWTPYFAVVDADVTAARILERGGTMAVGPLAFGTGRAGLAADPTGAVFGFWEGAVVPDWSVGRGSAPAWLELRTREAYAASTFYGEVFDWSGERPGCCVASYEHDHVVVRHGHDTVALIGGGALDEAPDPEVRPDWHVRFPVPDLEEAIEATDRAGGSTASPVHTSPMSRWVDLADPEGAHFTLVAPHDPPGQAPAR